MNNVKKYKFVSSVAIAIAVVLVIVVNVFVSVLNNKLPLKIDLTSNKMYELSDKTKEYLKNYDTPVDIYILAGESEQDGNIRTVLDKYAAANKNINVTNINMTSNPTFGKKYVTDGKSLQSNSVIVDGGDKFKTYTMTELYGVNAQTGQYTSLNVENKITSALKYVSSETMTEFDCRLLPSVTYFLPNVGLDVILIFVTLIFSFAAAYLSSTVRILPSCSDSPARMYISTGVS